MLFFILFTNPICVYTVDTYIYIESRPPKMKHFFNGPIFVCVCVRVFFWFNKSTSKLCFLGGDYIYAL